jgi:hypothetical protein
MEIEGEVLQAISFMKIAVFKIKPVGKKVKMFSLGMMQLTAALVTEGLNILLISSMTEVSDIIQNFVQFGFISQIDDLYAKAQKNNFLMKILRVSSIKINSTEEDAVEIKRLKRE